MNTTPTHPTAPRRRRSILRTLAVFLASAAAALAAPPNPPDAPLVVDAPGGSGAKLTWTAPSPVGGSGTVARYRIYRRGPAQNSSQVSDPSLFQQVHQTANASTLTWTDTSVSIHESYDYAVSTIDSLSAESARSPHAPFALKRSPFVLPWNDTSTSAYTDFSAWNKYGDSLLIGDSERIVVNAGTARFHVGSAGDPQKRIGFLGVNVCGAACFPDPAHAPVIAARMAQFGINLVRFHQMDRPLSEGGLLDSSGNVSTARVNRLLVFVRELKQRGIYSNINLRVLAKYANPDGGAALRFKGVSIFSEDMKQRQRTYAQQLLAYDHPDSAIPPLAADPAVAFIEIANEDGLIREWTQKTLDELPALSPTLHAELSAKWADWLETKYGTDDAWQAAWAGNPASSSYGEQKLSSYALSPAPGPVSATTSSSAAPWRTQQGSGNTAVFTANWVSDTSLPSISQALRIDVSTPSSTGYSQLLLNHLSVDHTIAHTLEFYGRVGANDAARTLGINWRTGAGHSFYQIDIPLTPSWQKYTISFPGIADLGGQNPPATISLTRIGAQAGEIRLAGFSLTTGDQFLGPESSFAEPAAPAASGPEHLGANPLASWEFSPAGAANSSTVTDGRAAGENAIRVTATSSSPSSYLFQKPLWETSPTPLHFGHTYELSFDVRASVPVQFTARADLFVDPWNNYQNTTMRASTTWVTKRFVFTVNQDNDPSTSVVRSRVAFGLGALPDGESIEFARLSLRQLPDNAVNGSAPALAYNFPSSGTPLPSGWSAQRYYSSGAETSAYIPDGRSATYGQNSLRITAPANIAGSQAAASGNLLLHRALSSALEYGATYRLTFDVRAETAFAFTASGQGNSTNFYPLFGTATFDAGPAWTTYSVLFTVSKDNDNNLATPVVPGRITFGLGALPAGKFVELANVSVRRAARQGVDPGDSLAHGKATPLSLAAFDNYYRQAQLDWIEFLWDTELGYWRDMKTLLAGTASGQLGTGALIVGTQGEYCPTILQAEAGMDVIDAHGYWQHPDKIEPDFEYRNVPMTATPDADLHTTTIAARSGRRIIGKPYMVSEYNHPHPLTFGTEGYPLFGAYAAMQGWNGVIAFDYESHYDAGSGTTDWGRGVEGWFTMGRAPAKMITLPAARAMLAGRPDKHVLSDYAGGIVGASYVTVRRDAALEKIRQRRIHDFGANDFGVPHKLAYVMPVGIKPALEKISGNEKVVSHRVVPVELPTGSLYISSTNELVWDSSAKHALVDTPMTKVVVGNLPASPGSPVALDRVSISSPGQKLNPGNWACFVLTRTDGDPAKNLGDIGTRWLLTATGYADNHRMKWREGKGPTAAKSGIHFGGTTPTLLENIDGVLTFTVPANATFHAHALDEDGNPETDPAAAPLIQRSGQTVTVTLPSPALNPWYGFEVTLP